MAQSGYRNGVPQQQRQERMYDESDGYGDGGDEGSEKMVGVVDRDESDV